MVSDRKPASLFTVEWWKGNVGERNKMSDVERDACYKFFIVLNHSCKEAFECIQAITGLVGNVKLLHEVDQSHLIDADGSQLLVRPWKVAL